MSRSASSGSGAVPARPRAWASLPPIQRTAGSMPQVAAPGAFVDALPGTRGLPPVVQQLGHEVNPMSAPGLVVARVRAVETASSSSIPAPRRSGKTAQRQAASATSESTAFPEPASVPLPVASAAPAPATSSSNSTSSAAMPVVARSASSDSSAIDGDGDDEIDATSVSPPEMTPVRSLPTVSRSAIRVPDRPLTSAASAVRPPVQRSHAGHSHAAATPDSAPSAASTPALPAPSGGMRRAPSSTVISRSAMPTVSQPAPKAPASPDPVDASGSLPALAPSTRRGVGEPTALPAAARPIGAPATPTVSRSTMAGPMPLASSSLRTTIQRTSDGEDDDEGDESEAPVQRSIAPAAARSLAPALPTLPVLSVSRSARDAGGAVPARAATPAAGAAVQRAATSTVRPIAAYNPIRPSVALQRDVDGDAQDGEDGEDGGVPAPWWAPAGQGSPALASLPVSGGLDGGPAVQRSAFTAPNSSPVPGVVTPAAPVRAASSRATWATQNVQRSGGKPATTPAKLPLAIPATPSAPSTPTVAADFGIPGTTVVFPQRSITSDPVVQTSRAQGASGPSTPTVQRDGGTTSSPTQATATSSAAAGPAAAKAPPSERDLDELAKQLFGRIRTRLRADLLHDREASGFTFDNV
ncbi:MAG TPA: hypothetical protein VJ850_03055 [Candidatus Limnocylindrales bacterium]|nr:hypothetical protein [Candidatus Limnocylindrales bacterium]